MREAGHFIDGAWLHEGALHDSIDPATGAVLGRYHEGSAALVEQAADAARRTFLDSDWACAPRMRAEVLFQFADRLEAARDDLTDLIVAENGKLRAEAAGEMAGAISEVRYYGGLARTVLGRSFEAMPGSFSIMHREAAGVAAIIVPWNAPVTLLVRSLAPAMAAGCTCIIKPAHQTPLIHARVLECLVECPALPRGVIHSVNEAGTEVGEALVRSDKVDVVSFTGSSATGRRIMAGAAPTLKRVGLELGGKAPAIVFDDADLDRAIPELARAATMMAGQICVAVTRFLVHDAILAAFTERMLGALRAVRTGPGRDAHNTMGALIDKANEQRLTALLERAADEADLRLRGSNPFGADAGGAFLSPSLVAIDDLRSDLVQQELFGPIVMLERFGDEAEALARANATVYGLAASVYTRDLDRAMRMSRAIRAGTVWLNCHSRLFAEGETGGYGQSGLGRLHGVEGLADFLETKHIYMEQGRIGPREDA